MKFKNIILLSFVTFVLCSCDDSQTSAISSRKTINDLNNLSMKIEASMLLDDDYSLYLKGSWDDFSESILLSRQDEFTYLCVLPSLQNKTYNFYTLIDNDENYREAFTGSYSFSHDNEEGYHMVNGFIFLPTKEKTWSILNGETASVDEHSDGSITIENDAWQSGFVAKDVSSSIKSDTYKMNAHFKGNKNASEIGEGYIGFLAYYKNSENYLFCYTMWHPDCTGVVRVIGMTGFINGIDVSWHDFMSAPTSLAIGPKDGFSLELSRSKSAFTVKLTADNGQLIEGATNVSQLRSELTTYLGFFVQGDKVDINNICFEEFTKEPEKDEIFSKVGDVIFLDIINQSNLVVKNNAWNSGFIIREDENLCSHYVVKSDMKGLATTNLNNVYIGLVPYYIDEINYIFTYVQWYEGKIKSIGMTGFSNGIDLSWHDYWDFANLNILPTDNMHLEVEIDTNTHMVKVSFGSISQTQTLPSVNEVPNSIGVYCYNDTVTFSNFVCEVAS